MQTFKSISNFEYFTISSNQNAIDIERQAEGSSVYLVIELKTEIKNTNDLYEQQKKDSDAKDQILKEYNSWMLYSIHLKHLNSKVTWLKQNTVILNINFLIYFYDLIFWI